MTREQLVEVMARALHEEDRNGTRVCLSWMM